MPVRAHAERAAGNPDHPLNSGCKRIPALLAGRHGCLSPGETSEVAMGVGWKCAEADVQRLALNEGDLSYFAHPSKRVSVLLAIQIPQIFGD